MHVPAIQLDKCMFSIKNVSDTILQGLIRA